MKKILFISIALLMACIAYAGNDPIQVKSEIRDVTVFLSGAQVTRAGSLNLEEGTQILIFTGLPQNMNEQSIQVKGSGDFTILSVTHQLNYLVPREKTLEIKALEDSLENLKKQLTYEQAILKVYQEEENLLLANKQIGGQNSGVKIEDLRATLELYRTRLTETAKLKIKSNLTITSLNEKISRISTQLATLSAANAPTSEVVVSVNSNSKASASLSLSYLVVDAGWEPEYDIRAIDVKNPVELLYKANVFQKTNENWRNVKLTLSTGNPSLSGSKPELQPWFLALQEIYQPRYKESKAMFSAPVVVADEVMVEKSSANRMEDLVTVTNSQTTASFNIPIPYSIPTDGKKYLVEIQKTTLPAAFEYQCVPKIDPDAFLIARITGWEGLNLLSGSMNLYFEGTYVGKSFLDMQNTLDTLELSLGRDKSIVIKREKRKDYTVVQTIGGNKKETRVYDISVRNNKKQDINMVIFDQLPVSTNKDISVDPSNISGANLEKETGKLIWKFQLKASENKSLRLAYEVKYPKDKKVILE